MNSSLANLDFGEQSITIYGTQNDPLIKCSDILIHVLGYKQCKDAGWFRKMADNSKYVTMVNHHDVAATQQVYTNRMFTERGIYTALMKSNKPIAEQFQD